MIIILGPDHSGKSTLAREIGSPYYHFNKDSSYADYLEPLCKLELFDAVLDRHAICEYPYSQVMARKFRFSVREWHNLLFLTLIQNPVIILCTHKPRLVEYAADQYLPYEKWDECLRLYRYFLSSHHIPSIEYNYATEGIHNVFLSIEQKWKSEVDWWKPMWTAGYGCVGSSHPGVLLGAERLGPNNMNNLPFETGPTGRMLADLLMQTGTPLGIFAVTNLVKSYRRDTRQPIYQDFDLLREELLYLKPKKVVFMGSVAKHGIKVAEELGIEHIEIAHFGYYSHRGISDIGPYVPGWQKVMGIIPSGEFKRVE